MPERFFFFSSFSSVVCLRLNPANVRMQNIPPSSSNSLSFSLIINEAHENGWGFDSLNHQRGLAIIFCPVSRLSLEYPVEASGKQLMCEYRQPLDWEFSVILKCHANPYSIYKKSLGLYCVILINFTVAKVFPCALPPGKLLGIPLSL